MECYKPKIPKMPTSSMFHCLKVQRPVLWENTLPNHFAEFTISWYIANASSNSLWSSRMAWFRSNVMMTIPDLWCVVMLCDQFFREMIEPCEERISKISSLSIQQTSVISKLWIFVVVYSWLRFFLGLFDLLVSQGSVGFPASARWNCFASIAILAWKFDSTLTTKALPICDVSSWRCKFVTFKLY